MSFSPASLGRSAVLLLGGRGDDSLTELLGVLVVPAFLLPGFGALDGRLGLFLAGFTALWMVISPDLRFFSSGFSVYAALAAAGYARAERAFGLRLKPVLIALLALNLVRMPIVHLRLFDPLPFTFGRETAWDNISRAMYPAPHYGRMVWWANRDLPENARLLVVIDIKAHYLWRRVYHDFQYVQPGLFLRWMRAAGSIPGFMKKLEQEGITHVLVVRQRTRGVGSHYAWRGGELAMAAEFFASHTLPVAKSEWVEVLKVERPPQPRRPLDGYEWILFTYPENELIVEHDAAILPMLEETARRAPWLKGVKGYLGIAYGRANRPAEAAAMLREAVREGGPTAAHSAFVLGQVMRMKGDVKAAELWWRTALRLDPNHADAHYNLAGVLYERGARREALTEAAAAAKLAPDKAEYAKARAEIARSLGAP
jgi:tetratricopeptide (TPR) repeat protein